MQEKILHRFFILIDLFFFLFLLQRVVLFGKVVHFLEFLKSNSQGCCDSGSILHHLFF